MKSLKYLLIMFLGVLNFNQTANANTPIRPEVSFKKIWVEHNVYSGGKKGMRIHVKFNINNMKGKRCSAVAYFYDSYGNPLVDLNGSYRTTDGHVSTSNSFCPPYDNAVKNDLILFLPYSELHQGRNASLYFKVGILHNKRGIKISNPVYFKYKQNPSKQHNGKLNCMG